MVTKIGRTVGAATTQLVGWWVGPTPRIARAQTDWKMEVWECTKAVVMTYLENETALLKKVYEQFPPPPGCGRISVPIPSFWPRLLPCSF